jgi:anti-sigma factor RsiW
MSCSPFDLKDYFLKELPSPQRIQVEAHVTHCPACREEVDRLQLTEAALFSLRDEEIPQRIAFVSDKIFEPSPVRRWFAGFWGSTARLGFASAAMLSASIFFFAATRPAPAPNPPAVTHTVAAEAPSKAEIQRQIHEAVVQAVAEVEGRQDRKTTQLIADLEHRADEARKSLQLAAGEYDLGHRRDLVTRSLAMVRPSGAGEPK